MNPLEQGLMERYDPENPVLKKYREGILGSRGDDIAILANQALAERGYHQMPDGTMMSGPSMGPTPPPASSLQNPNDPFAQAAVLEAYKKRLAQPGLVERLMYMLGVGRK